MHLHQNVDPFEECFPGESFKSRCHRRIRRFLSIDPHSFRTKDNLKSLTVIRAETLRHLLFYPCIIHCFSRFRFYWELLMIITYGMAFTVIPYQVAFLYGSRRDDESIFLRITRFVDVVCVMDIAINFLSSYQDHRTKNIVLKGSKIAWHYIRRYFWIDIFSTFPDIVMWMWPSNNRKDVVGNHAYHCSRANNNSIECYWDIIAILSLLKFLQMPLFFKYLVDYLQQHNKSDYFISFIRNTLTITFCFHFIVCLNFLIIRLMFAPFGTYIDPPSGSVVGASFWRKTNDAEKYGIIVYVVTYTITLFASVVEEKTITDMSFAFCLTVVGFMLHIWLISEAYMYLRTTYGPSVHFQEIRYELKEYVAFKHVPNDIQKRILDYYDYCYKSQFFRGKEIYGFLESDLKLMIAKETTEKLLIRHQLFSLLPTDLLHSIALAMSEAVYLKDDVICRNDSHKGQKLYLIVHGTVASYTDDGDEVSHLNDGNIFGEIEFLQYSKNLTSLNYVAVEECIISILNRKDFMRIMAENSEYIDEMRNVMRNS